MKIKSIKKVQRAEALFEKLDKELHVRLYLGSMEIERSQSVENEYIFITPKDMIFTGTAIEIIQGSLREYPEAAFYIDICPEGNGVRCVVFMAVYVETIKFDSKGKNLITRDGCAVRIVAEMAGGYLAAVKTNKDGSEECYAVHADEGCVSYDMENNNDIYTYED